MGISVALLAYKEEDNLRVLLPRIITQLNRVGETYEILVVDAAEPLDNTAQVCEEFGARYINQEEPFFAGAFKTAIKHASQDKFLILDADCSHDPIVIPAINQTFDETRADLVIGSRYVEGGISNDSRSSLIMSKILNGLFRGALKVRANDLSTDYRMYHTAALKKLKLVCERYDVLQEVILKLKIENGGSIHIEEVPIEFQKRAYGQSKRQLFVFIMHYIRTIISLTCQRKLYEKNPAAGQKNDEQAELFTNIILYVGIGCVGAVFDYLFFCLAQVLFHVPEVSNVMGALFGFFFTFYFNTFFNFISRGHYLAKFLSYAFVCLIGTFISTGMIYVFKEYLNIYVLQIYCIAVAAFVQFVLNKSITYRIFGNEGPRHMIAR
jgi:dolichol-phosphate mannosyltransferase